MSGWIQAAMQQNTITELWCHGIPEKTFPTIDNLLYNYLMQGFQKYA